MVKTVKTSFQFQKTEFSELSPDIQTKIDLLCHLIYHNEGYEEMFSFLINKHISESILKNIERKVKGEKLDEAENIIGFEKIVSIMDFVKDRAELSKTIKDYELDTKKSTNS